MASSNPNSDQTASLMTPAKLKQAAERRASASVTPAAYLDQMAADAGHQQLHRLGELAAVLQVHSAARLAHTPEAALGALEQALSQVDFGLLQSRGWWARTTGKSRSAGEQFAAQFEQVEQRARTLGAQVQTLADRQQADGAATERALVELEVEFHALEKIVEQGARWLQDMRTQLKARHAAASDPVVAQQVKDDAARCEILVARLKVLRAAATAAQQAHRQAQAAAAQRSALLAMLRQAVTSEVRAWHQRLAPLASMADADNAPALSMEGPQEAHRELLLCIRQAAAHSAALVEQEAQLSTQLGAVADQIRAAG
jgi:hypothetical protein